GGKAPLGENVEHLASDIAGGADDRNLETHGNSPKALVRPAFRAKALTVQRCAEALIYDFFRRTPSRGPMDRPPRAVSARVRCGGQPVGAAISSRPFCLASGPSWVTAPAAITS